MPPKKKAVAKKPAAKAQKKDEQKKKTNVRRGRSATSQKSASPEPRKGRSKAPAKRGKTKSPSPSPSPPPKKGGRRGRAATKKAKSPSPSPSPVKNTKRGRGKKSKTKSPSPSPQKKVKSNNVSKKNSAASVHMEKVVVKGGAAVDKLCSKKDTCHVFQKGDKIYAASLNQSNLAGNNNKFYIIQVLQHDTNAGQFYCFNRWGRVGVDGQQALLGPFAEQKAINEFEKKFHAKTVKGDYIEVHINYGEDEEGEQEEEEEEEVKQNNEKKKENTSKLHPQVQNLVDLIFDTKLMSQAMKEIGYDPKKMPLGKLADETIKQGYSILNELQEALKKKKGRQTYMELSSKFYSCIPHDFGFKKMIEFILDNEEKVKEKLNMLQSLTDMKLTTKMLSQGGNKDEDVIDQNYKKLKCNINPLSPVKDKSVWDLIAKCIDNTKESWKVDIKDVFEVEREGECGRFDRSIGNNKLLWHGSRITNYGGILSQGLRIAPPEAPVSGYLYGKGIYFADQFSKSAHYCRGTGNDILIMLCDVAVGKPNVLMGPDYNAANLPLGTHCCKGYGTMAPAESSYVKIPGADPEVSIPTGKPVRTTSSNWQGYNEYIVYKLNQVRIRYLLRVGLEY